MFCVHPPVSCCKVEPSGDGLFVTSVTCVTAILKRHGFEKESSLLAGKQTQPLIHVLVVCCTVEPSCKGHLKASIIIVSFTHTELGHSE